MRTPANRNHERQYFAPISPDRIYEGLVIASRIEIINTATDDLVPVNRTLETYLLQVGQQKEEVEVMADHLRENCSDLTPLTITYLYNTL